MRIVFMGSPSFAVPTLEALLAAGHEVLGVVTQPDRPAGRGLAPVPPPVKVAALARGLSVLQPPSLRKPEVIEDLRRLAPEAIVVAAFGQILRAPVLSLPPLGCINLHPSLLPKLRGAAPIPGAILARLSETGVTVMLMDEGMDSGPILAQRPMPVYPDDNAETLGQRLAEAGARLMVETLPEYAAGRIKPQPQDDSQATFTRPLRREDGLVDWTLPAEEIDVRARAYYPWPGIYTFLSGAERRPAGASLLKILKARALPGWRGTGQPGEVLGIEKPAGQHPGGRLVVAANPGALAIERLQMEGRRPVTADEFVRGQRWVIGARLGGGGARP